MPPVVLADSDTATKIFVLDTNVLMHDPSALFKFQEHHVYLPMTVLEELDNAKLGVSEVARNVRQTNRFIDELLTAQKQVVIEEGLQLSQFSAAEEPFKCRGRLYFQTQAHGSNLPESLPGNKNDNSKPKRPLLDQGEAHVNDNEGPLRRKAMHTMRQRLPPEGNVLSVAMDSAHNEQNDKN